MILLSAHDELQKILKEHEQIWLQLEVRSKELQQREEELKRLMEKEKLHKKIIELHKQLDAELTLKLEIESWKSCTELVEKMNRIQKELKKKEALVSEQRRANDELQDARKDLINFMKEQSSDSDIGIKRMGELNCKHFLTSANRIYGKELAEVGAMELCSLWEAQLEDPNWYPFKVVQTDCGHEEIIDKENEKLKSIRNDLGEEVYVAVITALRERREYNASGADVVYELWNCKDGRKATLAEGVSQIVQKWKKEKRKNEKLKRKNEKLKRKNEESVRETTKGTPFYLSMADLLLAAAVFLLFLL